MEKKKNQWYETFIYLTIGIILIIAPVVSLSIYTAGEGEGFDWEDVYRVWIFYLPFLITFIIHNHLLAPLLIYRKKKLHYLLFTAIILAIFQMVQCTNKPDRDIPAPPHQTERRMSGDEQGQPTTQGQGAGHIGPPHHHHMPPPLLGQHDVLAFLVMIMIIGMNLGVKLYFKTEREERQMESIRRENLEQQLIYLTHQISPHFFMNTLNNIHALVDIDPEKAKKTVLELSRIMRYMLYEGDKGNVPLQKEIDFLDNYVTLMKLRFTDKVKVTTQWTGHCSDWQVPPLLFITFVENAFKHGVSYQHPSFIDIQIHTSDEVLIFICRNSQTEGNQEAQGGVGLRNAKQRLQLIYGDKHQLDISDSALEYTVRLDIHK